MCQDGCHVKANVSISDMLINSGVASNNGPNTGLKAKQHVAFTAEEAHEVVRCMQDPIYFIRKYIKIIHPDKGLCSFDMYPFQEDLVRLMDKERFLIAKCARQSGKTTVVTGYLLWYALNHEFVKIAIIANKEKTAHDILKKVKLAYEYLPKFLRTGIIRWNEGDIEFENGSSIIAAATSSSAIRGGAFNIVFLDEFAFVPNNLAEEFYTSTYPVISSGKTTKIFIVSTPSGMNLFYNLWCQATDADPRKRSRFKAFQTHWTDVPGRDESFKAEAMANLGGDESRWKQEFECEFLGAANTLITGVTLQSLVPKQPLSTVEDLQRPDYGLSIYAYPEPNHVYVLLADVAEGKGRDFSTFHVIDITSMPYKSVCTYRNNMIETVVFPDIIQKVATKYNEAYVLIEINTDPQIPRTLYQDLEYENVIMVNIKGNQGQVVGSGFGSKVQLGVKMNAQVKRQGCRTLKLLIENGQLLTCDFHTISELASFVLRGGTYKADQGKHDDMVMCLVMFGWLVQQQYFKDLTDQDLHAVMKHQMEEAVESELCSFFIDNGQNQVDLSEKYLPETKW